MTSEFIFETAPFPACHASTLAESEKSLVAAWFGGTHEKAPDVGIWLSRLIGGRWTAPIEVADGVQTSTLRYPTWNPVLFQPKNGPLLLFYKVGPDEAHWWGMLMTSGDGGVTWSEPRRLPETILGPIKDKPVQLADGTLLCPSSTEDENRDWRVHFEWTMDLGRTWQRTGPLNDPDKIEAIQPAILFHGGTSLQAIGRTREGKIFTIYSPDNGKTWGEMSLIDAPNPNSGIDALTLHDGRYLMVYNDTPVGRTPLNIGISEDGRVWRSVKVLENEQGEYSYPAVIQTKDGIIHMTYTWQRTHIRYVSLDPATLQ
jgi:predicted neuraminidase